MSKYILISLTGIGICIQVFGALAARRVSVMFSRALNSYVDFLLTFEETPRSKFAKKYIPPMDVLQEETSSMYQETVRTFSSRHNYHLNNKSQVSLGISNSTFIQDVPNFGGNTTTGGIYTTGGKDSSMKRKERPTLGAKSTRKPSSPTSSQKPGHY